MKTMIQLQTDTTYEWVDWTCVVNVNWITHTDALVCLDTGRVVCARNLPAYLLARELENQGIARVVPCSWYRESKNEEDGAEDPGQ